MPQPDDKPLSLRALSRETGVPATTLAQWAKSGLELDHQGMCSRSDLARFCRSPQARRRPAAVACGERLDAERAPSTALGDPRHDRPDDPEQVRAIARDVRTAAVANMEALVSAARQAEDVAHGHREQLEAVLLSFRALDSALVEVTAPTTPHS